MLWASMNRVTIDGRQHKAREEYNIPINQTIRATQRAQIDDEDSEEEELVYERRQLPMRGGYGGGRNRRGYHDYDDYERSDREEFHLKVDLPYFNGTFNIKEFLDWLAEMERFFDYKDILEERRVKTVACRLKGGASA